MELQKPRPKKYSKPEPQNPLPLILKRDGSVHKFKGHFNGFAIVIKELDEMKNLNDMGSFGKSNLSRGSISSKSETPILRRRTFEQRKEFHTKHPAEKDKVIVVPDSEDEGEDYFTSLKPEYQIDCSGLKETLHLSLEEAFFLADSLQCLNIYNDGELLGSASAWQLFKNTDKYFVENYPVYYHFRAKNWVVKSGLKFGGDFLLYKYGPAYHHASYLVIIDVLDARSLERRNDLARRSMDIKNLLGLNRLCGTVGKDLLICQLLWPNELKSLEPSSLSSLSINEVVFKRWVPAQNREQEGTKFNEHVK